MIDGETVHSTFLKQKTLFYFSPCSGISYLTYVFTYYLRFVIFL